MIIVALIVVLRDLPPRGNIYSLKSILLHSFMFLTPSSSFPVKSLNSCFHLFPNLIVSATHCYDLVIVLLPY